MLCCALLRISNGPAKSKVSIPACLPSCQLMLELGQGGKNVDTDVQGD